VASTGLRRRTLTLLLAGGLVAGCAKEGFPPGGPVDAVPPEVVTSVPPPGELEVDRGQPIVLRFSEAMDHQSVERALFFTPDIGPLLRVSWHGEELRLFPRVSLRENTTFVVTLGADAADVRRNRMGRTFTLAFSTGETLDDASVSGTVFEEGRPTAGAWIWVYPAGDAASDLRADPALASQREGPILPLYVFQSDDDGSYEAGHLARGTYRVFAFRDADNRRFWEPDREPLAVPPADVVFEAPDDRVTGLNLNLAPRDTLGPFVRSASARTPEWVQLTLSEPVLPDPTPQVALEPVVDEGETPPADLPEPRVVRSYRPAASSAALVLQTTGLVPGRRYRAELTAGTDRLGNPVAPAPRIPTFTVPAASDTVTPRLTAVVPADSTRGLDSDTSLLLTFSSPIDTVGLDPWHLIGPDTLGVDRDWVDPTTVRLRPRGVPRPENWYHFLLMPGSLHSWTGMRGPAVGDTLVWQAVSTPGRGTLEFPLEADPLPAGGRYRVIVEGLDREAPERIELTPESPGRLATPPLREGAYRIWGWLDLDGDGRLGTGSVRPFRPAEPLGAIPDTLYVRESFLSTVTTPLRLMTPRRLEPGPPPDGLERRER
jgi:hypothetical protein